MNEFSIDGSNVAVGGRDTAGFDGVYTNLGGPLRTVADENTPVPGQVGFTFTTFDDDEITIRGDGIVLEGNGGWGRNRTGVHSFAVSRKNKARRPTMINQEVRRCMLTS